MGLVQAVRTVLSTMRWEPLAATSGETPNLERSSPGSRPDGPWKEGQAARGRMAQRRGAGRLRGAAAGERIPRGKAHTIATGPRSGDLGGGTDLGPARGSNPVLGMLVKLVLPCGGSTVSDALRRRGPSQGFGPGPCEQQR